MYWHPRIITRSLSHEVHHDTERVEIQQDLCTYTMLLVMCTLVAHVVRVHEDIRSSYSMRSRTPDTIDTQRPTVEMDT